MASSQLYAETINLRLKGVADFSTPNSPASTEFEQLTSLVKSQDGFVSQYWGPQVEIPTLFIWIILWETAPHQTQFASCGAYALFTSGLASIFDVQTVAPLMMFCTLNSAEIKAALLADVTEVSYFALSKSDSESKRTVLNALLPVNNLVKTEGKGVGAVMAWVSEVKPVSAAVLKPGEALLCGIFGYDSIAVHMEWNKKAGVGRPAEIFQELVEMGLLLAPADVPGNDSEAGWCHVHFREGR